MNNKLKECADKNNGQIVMTKGKWVISSSLIVGVLYLLLNFASPRNDISAPQPNPEYGRKLEKIQEKVAEIDATQREWIATTKQQFKHTDKKLDEISAKLDKG